LLYPASPGGKQRAAVKNFVARWNFPDVIESKPSMKPLTFLLIVVLCCYWCSAGQPGTGITAGQPDPAVTSVGEWSEPVSDSDGHTLRGRLVVCDDRPAGGSNHARVYLELEHAIKGGFTSPLEVYHDINTGGTALNLELRDGHDQPVPPNPVSIRAPSLPACWVTLPCDATVRLRSDLYAYSLTPNPDGLLLMLGSGTWTIPTNATGEFYLSGTFTPPADHPSALKYHIWQGTLKLPKVKVPQAKAG
jgi:hypothetical protein